MGASRGVALNGERLKGAQRAGGAVCPADSTVGCVRHVIWLGGAPASGKTTVATRLVCRYGLRLYSADTRTWVHRDRALAAGDEAARRWEALTPRQRWERSTVAEILRMSLHRQRGAMVLDDIAGLPASPLIVAEGSALPASAMSSGAALRSQAVWLMPTPDFSPAHGAPAAHRKCGRNTRGQTRYRTPAWREHQRRCAQEARRVRQRCERSLRRQTNAPATSQMNPQSSQHSVHPDDNVFCLKFMIVETFQG